jgi:hypothetical protein
MHAEQFQQNERYKGFSFFDAYLHVPWYLQVPGTKLVDVKYSESPTDPWIEVEFA